MVRCANNEKQEDMATIWYKNTEKSEIILIIVTKDLVYGYLRAIPHCLWEIPKSHFMKIDWALFQRQ